MADPLEQEIADADAVLNDHSFDVMERADAADRLDRALEQWKRDTMEGYKRERAEDWIDQRVEYWATRLIVPKAPLRRAFMDVAMRQRVWLRLADSDPATIERAASFLHHMNCESDEGGCPLSWDDVCGTPEVNYWRTMARQVLALREATARVTGGDTVDAERERAE